jgi:carboxyl-terminal processing protease
MTNDDERQSEHSGTPPDDANASEQTQGASPNERTAERGAGPIPPQAGWPPAPPGWPPAPGSGTSGQPDWPPAPPSWQSQGWPPAPQGWPNAPQTPPSSPNPSPTQPADSVSSSYEWLVSPRSSQRRRTSRLPLILTLLAAAMIAFAGGMVVDHLTVSAQQQAAQQPLQDFAIYQQALQDIRDHYVGRSTLTDQQLLYGSIKGMVDSLGDTGHSRFLTPQEYQQMTSQLSGHVAGIGILVTETNNQLMVVRVITGSPADKAGVKAGDQIEAVDGASTSGLTFDQLAAKIGGDVGTKVTISVIHAGSTTPVDLSMTRTLVTAPLVDWNVIPGTHIADIALFKFSAGASAQVRQAIVGAQKAGAEAIVLDLRGNPGGRADEARTVASQFLSTGVVYLEEDAAGNRTEVTVDTSQVSTPLPMVMLVDHDTASAAEIVAGALQDAARSKVVGVTTYGTGTVLEPFVLSDGSVVLLGISDWLTPAGHRIFGKGITPDQTVALPTGGQPIDPIDLAGMTVSQLQSSGDAQLLAALKDLSS